MELYLSEIEARVLGALIEKELTTPDYYPLSLNALTTACNQKSNRDPIMNLAETDVVRALDRLRQQGLALQAASDVGRVPKYRHNLAQKLYLEPEELALLCELLIRGPQTVGELRGRTERMYTFADLETVEQVLNSLADKDEALVTKLPRQSGRKESRYAHLLCGMPLIEDIRDVEPPPESARRQVEATDARLAALEAEISALKEEMAQLRSDLATFRRQFE